MSKNKASIIIPTFNAGPTLPKLIDRLRQQRAPWLFEIAIIDSSSTDGTAEYCEKQPDLLFKSIQQSEFSHGKTRNDLIAMTSGEFIAVLTQDALPLNTFWLYNLVTLLDHYPNAAGAFGRHFAWPEASPFTKRDLNKHFDHFNNKPIAMSSKTNKELYDKKDERWLQTLFFYSDNNSCMRRSVWESIPYPNVSYGEDQLWCREIIKAGYERVYANQAPVYHSHNYNPAEHYKRAHEEALYFKKHFNWSIAPKNLKKTINEINSSDETWAHENNIPEEAIAQQKEVNKAIITARYEALK